MIATHDTTDILSYTDTAVILKEGRLQAHLATKKLYQNPKNHYIGALFGEVNELPLSLFSKEALKNQKILLYPHELKVVSSSDCKVTVKIAYFKGHYYLIEAKTHTGDSILFEHPNALPEGETCYLTVEKSLFLSRSRLD